ncbi:hypothetical protein [Winogradskyella pulchriflava]|uniref:Lipoprotein n=1 Tax=Winogradskyella pulchriflava TaxID=1110688 RepID=A0ABV6Q5F2_9FLAO
MSKPTKTRMNTLPLKILFLFLLFLFSISCSHKVNQLTTQEKNTDKAEIEKLISTLSWDSFIIYTNYATTFEITNKNVAILESKGKSITPYLVNALKDEEKTVIAHIILTNIWEPEVNFINYYYCVENPFYEMHYQCLINNLKWYMPTTENNTRQIDEHDQDRIFKYWVNRTSD